VNEMIERVSQAIRLSVSGHVRKEAADAMARAAIEAMRVPTEAMWRAGSDSIDTDMRLNHAYAIEAQNTWRAMIDAALAK